MSKNAIFMIEGGKPLEMVKRHIADRQRVWQEVRELAKVLGANEVMTDRRTGVLTGVIFAGNVHADFTKPKGKHGSSFPKKGTDWEKRLKAQQGYRDQSEWISKEFGIPLQIRYTTPEGGWGSSCIGNPLTECGFLYLGEDGPYAMWAPDVPAIVAEQVAKGHTVEEPAASFQFAINGVRRIEQEEWDILVLQHKLMQKKAA